MSGFYSQNGVFVPIVAVCQKGPVYARQWYKESLFATIKQVQRVLDGKNWDRISVERRVKFRYSSEICNNGGQKRGSKFELEGIWNLLRSLLQYLETCRAGAYPGIILSVLVAQLVGRLGSDGFWDQDYGWGVRVRRPFGERGRSSVRYGTRLGDLKESWFILFSN
jgi:hypothetical protein